MVNKTGCEMKALLCKSLMGSHGLSYEDVESPEIMPGAVLIEVKAASLNFPDVLITQGKYQIKPDLPFIPGGEGSGIIKEVGEGVETFSLGDRVIFMNTHGAFAELVLVPHQAVTKIPKGLDFKSAAVLTIAYGTSYHALKQKADLQKGETIAVLGAAGGVGLATVELAKVMGARVIACASTDEKLDICKAAGADEVLNYSRENLKSGLKKLAPKGVDVVFDPVGGDYSESAIRALGIGGRHLVIGFAAGDIPSIPLNLILLKQCQIVGVFWGAWAFNNPIQQIENMIELFSIFAVEKIKPRVENTFKLSEFKKAYACLTGREVKGKVVFNIN
jgi:NADPH2:quinone reductase